jgi:cytochrome b6-f complex iron-sulfur subunit
MAQAEADAPAATRPSDAAIAETAEAETAEAAPAPRGNGAAAPTAPTAPAAPAAPAAPVPALPAGAAAEEAEAPEARARRMMNRREFLTYTWAAALGLVALQSGVGTFLFMYPRFQAGEFGGEFFLGPADAMPATDAAPIANSAGKFWLVNTTDEGIKAIYMVCTHLGCLYKWEPSTVRFECPCHGSKFSREGFYIEGPAPRSLDTFAVREENGEVIVDTGA